jgi:ribosomal protein S18 acetylase RimI-like enzyme
MEHSVHVDEVQFEPFNSRDLAEWLVRNNSEYIEERVAAGDSPEEAKANAEASWRRTFPNGSPAPGQLAGRLVWGGQRIGELWVGRFGSDPERWWVWDVRVDEPFRGRGLGRQAMLLAEELARTNGAVSIGLNVFADNTVARNLYASLGYRESSVHMRKQVSTSADREETAG